MGAPTVLIIEYEKDIRKLLEYNLSKSGYKVIKAKKKKKGIKKALDQSPEIIILGTFPSEKARARTCRKLRTFPSLRQVTIICLTHDDHCHERSYNKNIGADACILTPIKPRKLVKEIHEILATKVRLPKSTDKGKRNEIPA